MEQKILKERLLKVLETKGNDRTQLLFLKECLINYNYLDPLSDSEPEPEELDPIYDQFVPRSPGTHNVLIQPDDYDLNGGGGGRSSRTFIAGIGSERLQKLQQRGIETEEMELGKLSELYDIVLNKLKIDNIDKFKSEALNLYKRIMDYYKTNVNDLHILKGSLKKGYIMLCLFYTLLNNLIIVDRQKFVNLFDKFSLRDLPDADRNMKEVIFKGMKLFDSNIYELNLCNMKKFFNQNLIDKIVIIMDYMKNIFGNPLTQPQIAACIYYAANKLKSGRVKIKESSFVTYDMLTSNCDGKPTRKTIDHFVENIVAFFKQFPELEII